MQYRIRPGYTFGKDASIGEGEIITLTEKEAEGFADKLVPVTDEPELPQEATEAPGDEAEAEAVQTPKPAPKAPQRAAKRPKAKGTK